VDRELVLTILGVVLTGAVFRLGSLWRPADSVMIGSPQTAERRHWRRLWAPLAPVVVVLCALAGWAALEPDNSEVVPRTLLILSLPCAFVWMRALSRAVRALTRRPAIRTIGVVGLWSPRIIVSDEFHAVIDKRSAAAAAAHEAAHVRHRDPLRLWLAQLATDLQWPSSRADERLQMWTRVVEFARDDEARRCGVEGADLAAAIIAAVRLHERDRSVLALVGDRTDFETRIRRLLVAPPPDEPKGSSTWRVVLAAALALVAIAVAGALCGETIVRTVFSVLP
jgi:hypothetical protein